MATEQATKEKVVVTIFWPSSFEQGVDPEEIVDPITVKVIEGLLCVTFFVGDFVQKIETNARFRVHRKEEPVKPVPATNPAPTLQDIVTAKA